MPRPKQLQHNIQRKNEHIQGRKQTKQGRTQAGIPLFVSLCVFVPLAVPASVLWLPRGWLEWQLSRARGATSTCQTPLQSTHDTQRQATHKHGNTGGDTPKRTHHTTTRTAACTDSWWPPLFKESIRKASTCALSVHGNELLTPLDIDLSRRIHLYRYRLRVYP